MAVAAPATKPAASTFEADIRPVLESYCYACHGGAKIKGDLNLAQIRSGESAGQAREIWTNVAGRVDAREMPPKKAPQPSDGERARLLAWAKGFAKPGEPDCQQIANDKNSKFYHGYVMSRRLTREEYNNTIRDLFGADLHLAGLLPADGAGGEGFDNNGDTLYSSPILVEKYMQAAQRVVDWAFADPQASARFAGEPHAVLAAFMQRAFRRPVNAAEVERFLTLYRKRGSSVEGMKLAVKGVLVSPHFLFLVEPDEGKTGVYPLGSYPLAARLSYFLWASMPDDELLRLAGEGRLQEDAVLRGQVRRMLQDPKAHGMADVFATQWFGIDALGVGRRPDAGRFPDFDDALADAMRQEAISTFAYILRENRPLLELLDARYTFVNERLARHYGVAGITGPEMRRVELSDPNRGGVLGMSGILTVTSYPLRTSPVLRGKWVLEELLGTRIPPPPPTAGTLPPDDAQRGGRTMRQQLEAHRANPECASCHSKMDPLGFGLENFDAVGRWRTQVAGQPIDASGVMPNGERFASPAELKRALLARKDEFARNLSKKMLGYALGRSLNSFDRCVIDDSVKALQSNDYRSSALMETIALSKPFRFRFSAK